MGRVVTQSFNLDNLLVTNSQVTGLLPTYYEYDFGGRLTSIATGDRTVALSYDARGQVDSVTDPFNRETRYSYDLLDRVTQIDRPDGSRMYFQYDNAGNMTVLTTPTPADNVFAYNGVNKVAEYTTPLGSVTSYLYDKERKLASITLPSTRTITNTYTHGRLTSTQTPEWTNTYTYSCRNLIETISRGSEQLAYTYDGKLPLSTTLTGTLNQTISSTWNNDFNVTSFTYSGSTENISYDDDGLTTGIGRFTISRNSENGLPEAVFDSSFSLSRSFNGYGEVASVAVDLPGATTYGYDLIRDDTGRISSKTENVNGVTTDSSYTYDNLGRLLTVTKDGVLVEEYRYDVNGNRTYEMNSSLGISGRTSVFSAEDHIITTGGISFEFDYDDNLAARIDANGTTEYQYSSTGELMSVTLPDGTAITYVNDPNGRRIAKLVNGTVVEKYLWSGLTTLLAVYDGSDNLVQRFEYADGRVPVAMTMGGSRYYLADDQVGTLRLVTDSSGNVVKRFDYDTFGNIINDSNPGFTLPFGFAGGLHDRDTGLVRFGYRDYMPEIGKWTAKDPILFAGGDSNLYGYVQNDPVNWVDPWGLEPNGCGTAKTDLLVPDFYPEACNNHDLCYEGKDTNCSKGQCDNNFWKDSFAESGPWPNVIVPTIYWIGVRVGGVMPSIEHGILTMGQVEIGEEVQAEAGDAILVSNPF